MKQSLEGSMVKVTPSARVAIPVAYLQKDWRDGIIAHLRAESGSHHRLTVSHGINPNLHTAAESFSDLN